MTDFESLVGKVKIDRVPLAKRDERRKYQVVIDGRSVGLIGLGEDCVFDVAPGKHTIVVKISWCSSETVAFNIGGGGEVLFHCGPAGHPDVATISQLTWKRTSYLGLWMEEPN